MAEPASKLAVPDPQHKPVFVLGGMTRRQAGSGVSVHFSSFDHKPKLINICVGVHISFKGNPLQIALTRRVVVCAVHFAPTNLCRIAKMQSCCDRLSLQALLRRAAKARVDRMCKNHAKRQGLNVPAWFKEQWEKGNKDQIAAVLENCNFDKDSRPISVEQKERKHGV